MAQMKLYIAVIQLSNIKTDQTITVNDTYCKYLTVGLKLYTSKTR